jgi:predicted DCC family thiol-disulfide oxidoreductase YuxK
MKNIILVYDDNCPFCCWYSGQFVRFKFLTETGRQAFSTAEQAILSLVDLQKSKNEIALIDKTNGQVFYGIDSLLEILDQKIPFIKKTGNLPILKWVLKKLYKLISYNRKVIVAKKCGPGSIDCSPDLNTRYRLLFIGIFLVFNTLMLFPLHSDIFSTLPFYNLTVIELQTLHVGFVFINSILALSLTRVKAFEYLGQLNMLALITTLLLIALLFLTQFNLPQWFFLFYLTITALIIFKEYIRRMDFAGILVSNKWLASINLLSITFFLLLLFHRH